MDVSLFGKDGRPQFGIYNQVVSPINYEDFRLHGDPTIFKIKQKLIQLLRLKKWQFMGVCNEELVFGLAVVHVGYLSNCFAYVYDKKSKELKEYNILNPFASNTLFEGSLLSGKIEFDSKDVNVKVANQPDGIVLEASLYHNLDVKLKFDPIAEPLSLIGRIGLKGFNYTTKEAGVVVSGSIRLENKYYTIKPDVPSGIVDYTFGYPARRTFWNWSSGLGKDSKKKDVSFNLSQGINETGQTENAFWINGKMVKTDLVQFEYDDLHLLSPWKITSNDGKVNLVFTPEGERKASVQMLLIASRFHQLFGKFSGELVDGKSVCTLEQVSGFTEEHDSLW